MNHQLSLRGRALSIDNPSRGRRARSRCASAIIALIVLLNCAHATFARGGGKGGDPNAAWPSVYRLSQMLTFYVVNDGGSDFSTTIRWTSQWRAESDTPVMVRVLDPNENLVARYIDPGLKTPGPQSWTEFSVPVTASSPGVYQVIVTGASCYLHFQVSPTLAWGVYGYPYLTGTNHLADAWIYLPPNLASLSVQCQGTVNSLRLTDADGLTHVNISGANASGMSALPSGQDQVWRLQAQAPSEFGVTFGVAPIIACPDQATALAIKSSIDVLEDGTICYHKFQIAAHDLLQQYAQLDASAFAVSLPNLSLDSPQWIADPPRNSLLLGSYGVLPALAPVMAEQNLDPASPWFGCIRAWHNSDGSAKPNPWITYNRLQLTDPAPGVSILAAVHGAEDSLNPLYHNVNLRNRIIVAALRQTMMLREHELPESTYLEYDGGDKAFDFAHFLRAFPWVVQQCPGDVQAVYTAAMRRYVDRMALANVPQIANQWAFIMMGLQSFARGTGEQQYRDFVQTQINWLLQRRMAGFGAMPAGYFSEGEGPDASYAGINMHLLGWLCEDAGSGPLKQAVIESFNLFDHTIAPEPAPNKDTWLGTTAFNHRRPTDWVHTQWTGGVGILADDTADAAVMLGRSWLPWRPARNASEATIQQLNVQNSLEYHDPDAFDDPIIGPCILDGPMIPMAIWEHFMATPVANAQLPMKASNRFTRKFGPEFLAARRPSYYAFTYCGKTYDPIRQAQRPNDPNVQYPRNGGGLNMLWSPKFGSSILAQNWSAYSSNALIAIKGGDTYFEDYWKTSGGLNANQARANINGQLTDGKTDFRRTLTFAEDRITCDIRIQPKQAVTFNKLWECFPYPLDKPDPIDVTLYDDQGKKINGNNKVASAIVFSTTANEVHIIAFDQPRRCEYGSNHSVDLYGGAHDYGRVLTQLPKEWNANQVRTVKWTARAVRPGEITATIKQMVGAMQ